MMLIIGNFRAYNNFKVEFWVSDYYYNGTTGNFLAGILFVRGFFLMAYKGYDRIYSHATNLGCVFAVVATLFPTQVRTALYIIYILFMLLLFFITTNSPVSRRCFVRDGY